MKWKEETRGRMFEPGSKEGDRVWMGIHDSILGVLKNAAVPAPELPAFVAEATSAE
jgi:hypothetical protein